MTNWGKTRLVVYLSALFAGIAGILQFLGLASFDYGTWQVTIHPFDVRVLAGLIAGPIAAALAAIMVLVQGKTGGVK